MFEVKKETLELAYNPFDVVTDLTGNVGYIQEVSVNQCQDNSKYQISYAINWIVGQGDKVAWYNHNELQRHCNLFEQIAKNTCHPMGNSASWIGKLFKGWL